MRRALFAGAMMTGAICAAPALAQENDLREAIAADYEANLEELFIHFHQNPELSHREFETAKRLAAEIEALGYDVTTGVGGTGVVAVLENGDGPTVLVRADMDGLPVKEDSGLDYMSTATQEDIDGIVKPVMHACGHDTHVAILMGVAEVLAQNRQLIKGTVKFIFQPAEEGAPEGEEGGALLMVKEGVMENPKVDAIFGLHINSQTPVGMIRYKSGGAMAASQSFRIRVQGKQTHGSQPWGGVDPILISAKIIDGLQTIISRETNLTNEAAVITVGKIQSGVRFNIIPESAEMIGTIRTLDYDMKDHINRRMEEMVPALARAYGGDATIEITDGTEITYNDPELVSEMLPTLQRVAGPGQAVVQKAITGAEDFSYFQKVAPGFYFFLGGMTPGNTESYPHHTPDFKIDDSGLLLGVRALSELTLDYMNR